MSPRDQAAGAVRSARWLGVLLVLISAVAFSAKAVLAKIGYRHGADPIALLTLRMAFSLPFFGLVALFSARGAPAKLTYSDRLRIVVLGVLGYYLASVLDFIGLTYISAGFERLILFVYPTLVVLLSALFLRRRVGRSQLWALLLTYAGIALVAHAEAGTYGTNVPLGAALIFGCALAYAIYLVGSGELLPRLGTLRFTSLAMCVSTLAIFVHFFVTGGTLLGFESEVYWLGLGLAIVCTVLPVFMLAEGLRRIGSGSAAILSTVGPVSTIVLAHLALDEPIGARQLAGTALVLAGATFVARAPAGA